MTAYAPAVLFGLAAGLLIAWIIARGRIRQLSSDNSALRDDCAKLTERSSCIPELEERLENARRENRELSSELARVTANLENERSTAAEKVALLEEAREALANHFKALANDILEEREKRFEQDHLDRIGQILEPLKTRIREFQGKVEEVYVQEGKDRAGLAEQVRRLMELNQSLSRDAQNLTSALKGSSKIRGIWGELVLERVLEGSGLRRGEEFVVQGSRSREDGSRAQPDVVIRLPENRNLVVDAKVSLNAYEEYAGAEEGDRRQAALKRHVDSVRTHVRELSAKKYQDLYGLNSIDFVVMFIPVEPAFLAAVEADRSLFDDAWNRNVLLVSPSTLLFVVRTVAHLWRQEARNRNAQEIARRGADLYEKFVGFVEELETVGERLRQAQRAYEAAHGKLASGKGNLVRQAEMLRELGVQPSKSLRTGLVEGPESLPSE